MLGKALDGIVSDTSNLRLIWKEGTNSPPRLCGLPCLPSRGRRQVTLRWQMQMPIRQEDIQLLENRERWMLRRIQTRWSDLLGARGLTNNWCPRIHTWCARHVKSHLIYQIRCHYWCLAVTTPRVRSAGHKPAKDQCDDPQSREWWLPTTTLSEGKMRE